MSVSRKLGHLGNERGRKAEVRLCKFVEQIAVLPDAALGRPWVYSARLATREEDRRGIDVVVSTDVGPLYLQSKSSSKDAQRFRAKRRPILVEVVVAAAQDDTLMRRVRFALDRLRASVLLLRAGGQQ